MPDLMAASALEDPEQQHHEPARMENTSGAPSPANGSAVNLTDSEDDRQLREARTVLQDLEFQDHEREHARHEKGRPDQPSSATAPPPAHHSPLQRAAVYANLATFSILGAATRIGLTRLCTYNGQSVFATAVSQAVGCAVMGLVSRNKVPLESVWVSGCVVFGVCLCLVMMLTLDYNANEINPTKQQRRSSLYRSGHGLLWFSHHLFNLDVRDV